MIREFTREEISHLREWHASPTWTDKKVDAVYLTLIDLLDTVEHLQSTDANADGAAAFNGDQLEALAKLIERGSHLTESNSARKEIAAKIRAIRSQPAAAAVDDPLIAELRSWKETDGMGDDARRKVWLMHKAADALALRAAPAASDAELLALIDFVHNRPSNSIDPDRIDGAEETLAAFRSSQQQQREGGEK